MVNTFNFCQTNQTSQIAANQLQIDSENFILWDYNLHSPLVKNITECISLSHTYSQTLLQ